jgi:hypothetical protein
VALLAGCQYLPASLRAPKLPFRTSPLRHDVTVQPAPGMGPPPFTVDRAEAAATEVRLILANASGSPIRVVWREGTFIAADSIGYAIGVRAGASRNGGLVSEPTTIDPGGKAQVTAIALTREGKPVSPTTVSVEPPFRIGLKLAVETAGMPWKGTLWVFVS